MVTDVQAFFIIIIFVYIALSFVDWIFRTCMLLPYTERLSSCGIKIQLFQIRWFTTSFNRVIHKLSASRPKFQSIWFSVGMYLSLIALPFALFFIIQSVYALFINWVWKTHKVYKTVTPFLKPAFPGINIPISDLGYYFVTLLICTVFHELGHAIAAVREGIHINGIGLVVVFMIPICYVKMEGLQTLPVTKQMKIYCAGIWHNICMALLALLLLLIFPKALYPFYEYGYGVGIKSVHQDSGLYGPQGLKVGNVVTSINQCEILEADSWLNCIVQAIKSPVVGYCITSDFVHSYDESIQVKMSIHGTVECCRNGSESHLCFEYLETPDDPVELPQYSCLKARMVVQNAKFTCQSTSECSGYYCLRPSLVNGTKLVEIEREENDLVLFLGNPGEIYSKTEIDEFVQKTRLPTSIPNGLKKFFHFVMTLSGAFAVLNLIPCFYLDGQHIISILVHILLRRNIKHRSVRFAIGLAITIVGTFILVLYTILVFVSVFSN